MTFWVTTKDEIAVGGSGNVNSMRLVSKEAL
jgi:hypothetical protein